MDAGLVRCSKANRWVLWQAAGHEICTSAGVAAPPLLVPLLAPLSCWTQTFGGRSALGLCMMPRHQVPLELPVPVVTYDWQQYLGGKGSPPALHPLPQAMTADQAPLCGGTTSQWAGLARGWSQDGLGGLGWTGTVLKRVQCWGRDLNPLAGPGTATSAHLRANLMPPLDSEASFYPRYALGPLLVHLLTWCCSSR